MSNFKGPQYNYIVAADSIVAADIVVDAGVLSFGVPAATALKPICDFQDLIPKACRIIDGVAATLQVDTVTFTAANSTEYMLQITQWNPVTKAYMNFIYSYTSLASGDTATTIGDEFRTQINADTRIRIAATGTTTLVLTAETATETVPGLGSLSVSFALFTTNSISPATTAVAHTTPGVMPVGTTSALALEGITVAASTVNTRIHLEFNANMIPSNARQVNQPNILDIIINEAASDFTNVLAKWNYILLGRDASARANSEILAVI